MGKKSLNKIIRREEKSAQIAHKNENRIQENELHEEQLKLSKKQKKKINKDFKRANRIQQKVNSTVQNAREQLIQVEGNPQQEIGQIYPKQQQNQSFISLSSQPNQVLHQRTDLQFQKGNQGFEFLIDETNEKQVNHVQIKRNLGNQAPQTFYFYQAKRQNYYKVTSTSHQRLNLTHLNESVVLNIVDEHLLKNGTRQGNLSFWINGKTANTKMQFMKSAVFKITNNEPLQKNQKKKQTHQSKNKNKNEKQQKIEKLKQNVQNFIRPSSQEQARQFLQFLREFDWNQECLLISKNEITFSQTNAPFSGIDEKMLKTNNSLLIMGKKNRGKSTFAQYLKSTNPNTVCILDCDIGRSLTVSGCVSLLTDCETINLWIGEFTPFNCIEIYVGAIKQLYKIYRQKYFSKKLVINTMGYLTGLGQMIIYEIYNLINPSEIIVMTLESESYNNNSEGNISNILHNIKTGVYLKKLLTNSSADFSENQLRKFNQKKISLNVQYLKNQHAQTKGIPVRFQSLLCYKKNAKNIVQLIQMIKRKEFQTLTNIPLFEQDKLGTVTRLGQQNRHLVDMRIVLIGKLFPIRQSEHINQGKSQAQLFIVYGIGFGFQGQIHFSRQQIQKVVSQKLDLKEQKQSLVGILGEGIDFQKNFYLINQLSLIDLELQFGSVPYMLPLIKGIGSKGTRNNPSKNI